MRRDAERNVERDLVASVPVLVVRDLSERRSKRTRSHRENVHSGFGQVSFILLCFFELEYSYFQTFVVKLHLNVVRSPRTGTVISLELLRLPTRRVQKTAERILETFLKLVSKILLKKDQFCRKTLCKNIFFYKFNQIFSGLIQRFYHKSVSRSWSVSKVVPIESLFDCFSFLRQ